MSGGIRGCAIWSRKVMCCFCFLFLSVAEVDVDKRFAVYLRGSHCAFWGFI